MFLAVFLSIGAVALGLSVVTLASGLSGRVTPEAGTIASAAACGLWIIWSLHATAIEVADGSGGVITQSYPSLRIMGVVMFAVMLISLVRAAMATLGMDDGIRDLTRG